MTEKAFKLKEDRFNYKAGTRVYEWAGYDYGLACEDSYFFKEPHVSVTINQDQAHPFFTVPVRLLEPQ